MSLNHHPAMHHLSVVYCFAHCCVLAHYCSSYSTLVLVHCGSRSGYTMTVVRQTPCLKNPRGPGFLCVATDEIFPCCRSASGPLLGSSCGILRLPASAWLVQGTPSDQSGDTRETIAVRQRGFEALQRQQVMMTTGSWSFGALAPLFCLTPRRGARLCLKALPAEAYSGRLPTHRLVRCASLVDSDGGSTDLLVSRFSWDWHAAMVQSTALRGSLTAASALTVHI